jgi:hypothetical protein
LVDPRRNLERAELKAEEAEERATEARKRQEQRVNSLETRSVIPTVRFG